MIPSLKTVAAAALALPGVALATLDKPALWGNLDFLHAGLAANLPSHSYKVAAFLDGYIATACLERAQADGYDPKLITTYSVTFSDCTVPWLMCRHRDSPVSLDNYLDFWSKVPVLMRQGVKASMLVPGGGSAYAFGDVVVIIGPIDNVAVYIHETTHTLDGSGEYALGTGLSASSIWTDAYNADSAVPDSYAQSSQAENLAQQSGPLLYNRYVPGGIASVASGFERLANQQATIARQGDNGKYGPIYQRDGATCSNRKDNGGYSTIPSRKRDGLFGRLSMLNKRSGPFADGSYFPNTAEEQQAFIESQGLSFHPGVKHGPLGAELVPTNCTGYI
ncbi:hypothetical protein GQ53DRAFT_674887 [Thozetella sp. PMI_491]|nr:hypothetical protein GQ53DRAFT_674887 [Thozetella sp. PMI_491]